MNFKILEIINNFPEISQKKISLKTGISIGKINKLLKEYEKENLIQIVKTNNKYEYKISDSAKKKFFEYIESKKIKVAVILSDSKKMGRTEIDGEPIIERSIDLLIKNEIKNIFVVQENNSPFSYLEEIYENVKVFTKEDTENSGTYFSLLKILKYIVKEDEILVLPDDIIYSERALTNIIKSSAENAVLTSNSQRPYGLYFIEKNGKKLLKISKDLVSLKNINGTMVGITKISADLITCINSLEISNENFTYEAMLSELANQKYIEILGVDSLVWGKITDNNSRIYFNKNISKKLKKVDDKNSIDFVERILLDEILVKREDIDNIENIGGMTNKNFLVSLNGENFIVRNPGLGTAELINRKIEQNNIKKIIPLEIDAKVIFFNSETGVKMSEYIENSETITQSSVVENLKGIAEILKKLHSSDVRFENFFDVSNQIKIHEEKVKGNLEDFYPKFFRTKKKIEKILKNLKKMHPKFVSCHNDTVPENFIKADRIYLIDWEYSALNEAEWDLAAFSLESSLDTKNEKKFLKYYYGKNLSSETTKKILMYKILQDFLWSIWTVVKYESGIDFGSYGIDRYTRCLNSLEVLENEYK